jgi:hypothetical protein
MRRNDELKIKVGLVIEKDEEDGLFTKENVYL